MLMRGEENKETPRLGRRYSSDKSEYYRMCVCRRKGALIKDGKVQQGRPRGSISHKL